MADIAPFAKGIIPEFTDAQNAALANVQLGQLVFIRPVDSASSEQSDGQSYEHHNDGVDQDDEENDDASRAHETHVDSDADEADEVHPTSGDQQTDSTTHTSDAALEPASAPAMYIITHVTRNGDGAITNMKVAPQTYAPQVGAQFGTHNYHIFGQRCRSYHEEDCGESCPLAKSIVEATSELKHFIVDANPNGDLVRRYIASNGARTCIAGCNGGWLTSVNDLDDMIRLYVTPLKNSQAGLPGVLQPPVCPVCIGRSLLQEQQRLQHQLLSNNITQAFFTSVADFHSRLNPRRQALYYSFRQFDEREWGFAFDDMLSEDEEADDEDDDRFQDWAEANDPNHSTSMHPVSEATIEALTRKAAKDKELEDDAECQVCKELIEPEATLLELPCGHTNFHEDCLSMWLKQSDGCPNCRALVPDVDGKPRETTAREVGVYPSAPRQSVPGFIGRSSGGYRQRGTYRMTTDEARRYLNIDGIPLEEIDKEMLTLMFDAARADHGGDRTENAIASIERATGMRPADDEDAEGEDVDDDDTVADTEGLEDDRNEVQADENLASVAQSEIDGEDAIMSDV